jgi:hypothetical protein
MEYLKDKISEFATNNKNKIIRDLYRGINEFKKRYQPRINIVRSVAFPATEYNEVLSGYQPVQVASGQTRTRSSDRYKQDKRGSQLYPYQHTEDEDRVFQTLVFSPFNHYWVHTPK